jgi:hypothetical protein
MSGYDVIRYRDQKVLVPGKRDYGLFADYSDGEARGFYLFADEESLEIFRREWMQNASAAHQAQSR